MIAEIYADGTLKITAETGIERYALRQWWDAYSHHSDGKSPVVLQVGYEEPLQAGAVGVLRGRDAGLIQK